MSKVAIYCRLSEEDRDKLYKHDDSESIKNQKDMLLQYTMQQGWEIYNIYSDDNYSGGNIDRPEFQRLIRDAEARKFDIVLCKSQSRFSRELETVERYIHGLFPKWGIRFLGLTDHADTADEYNKLSRRLNAIMDECYIENISKNIKSIFNVKRQNGYHIGSFALYGYMKDPDKKGHLIIDEDAAEVVREVFTLFSKGMGKTAIARHLNEKGIPNPTEYKRQKGLRYYQAKNPNGTLWKYSAISDMLVNEMYIGNMVQGKYESIDYKTKENKPRSKDRWYRVEGTHEPIISLDLWNRVQAMVKNRTKPFITGNIGIFAGKVHCSCCGYTMRSSKSRGEHYLQCSTKHVANGACDGAFISLKKLESIVLGELQDMTKAFLDKDELEQKVEFAENLMKKKEKLQAQIDGYKKEIKSINRGITECYKDKAKGDINLDEYNSIVREFREDKAKYEKVVSDGESQLEEIERLLFAGDNRRELIEQYTNVKEITREIVETMIDHIVVGRRIPKTKIYPVEIHWNF